MKNKNTPVVNDEHENRLVKKDFIFVVTLNLVLFAVMLGLYFWNHSTGELDKLFSNIVKF